MVPNAGLRKLNKNTKVIIVAIEGLDGCGKTTQAKMLTDRLRKGQYEAIYVQPAFILSNILCSKISTTSISPRKVRTTKIGNLKSYGIFSLIRKSLMGLLGYLYALSTYVFMVLYLGRNRIVVCDRYFYQFFFDLFGNLSEKVIRIFPKPDITFFLDGDIDLLYSRMSSPSDVLVCKGYYVEVTNLYRRISGKYDFIRIDATLDKQRINDIIFSHLVNPSFARS